MTTSTSQFEKPWPGFGIGGRPALEFVNTLDWRLREPSEEMLKEFPDLVRWGFSAGVLLRAEARRLLAWGREHPRQAAQALAEAIEVREAIAAIFQALVRDEGVPAAPLARLNRACHAAGEARALVADGRNVTVEWRSADSAPHRPAWYAALDAAGLLTSDDQERVRQCGDAQCGWMFLDTSRNGTRRWCTMKLCGNRNKARSFYRRSHDGTNG